ncbi:MAG: glycosyltransferase [Candidatus Aenigmarchaeota archaeon]|nr:glycosyltransferase [Candidatus Aenigmarchaeota archaeon]NIP40342.1 glycosyltransferase [Candidatus Aenigmarchaeota archaeon]NIQ17836.1 glycosyltransferase [Candidatus Aenigmarchaeota archaeon]NIS73217.1 glycosyltransferase [Candidatus Aenigmarchaeota archaeon]
MEKFGIIAGIPTYNEAENVGFVVKQVERGLRKHYPGKKALIVCCDGNSTDRTKSVFLDTKTFSEKRFLTTKLRGKGNGLKMLFNLVVESEPEATIIVDADLKSIEPGWVRLLAGPLLKGYDYVTPVYVRERYDGTITNHIAYPIVYGLFGRDVRQPIAGDFAFSKKLVEYWLDQRWTKEAGEYGIDIFMTTHAIFNGFRICQTNLGHKIHRSSEPRLSEMFLQVVKSLFDNTLNNMDRWRANLRSKNEKIFGMRTLPEPRNLKPDPERILQTAIGEYQRDKLKNYLSKENFKIINSMFFERNLNIDEELWARTIYDLLYSYSLKRKMDVIRSLRSLYFAKIYTFFKRIPEYTTEEVESEIRGQAKIFRKMRSYLVRRIIK